ncbi:MAG: cytochrome c oxidase subunit 3 family protein [Thiotrichaceae bacterium]|nr:cytochrome c oxidase subunit 3 family protein [Thiotrichaceae bacterium]
MNSIALDNHALIDNTIDSGPVNGAELHKKKYGVGNFAIWLLIFLELTEFAFFFIVFLIGKSHYPEIFYDGPTQLNTMAGMFNTLILISGSFFVARAVSAIRYDNPKKALLFLWLTFLTGAAYCVIKIWEYQWNVASGFDSSSNYFFGVYYYLTFNHFVHVLMGMTVILWLIIGTYLGHYDAKHYSTFESGGLYWHMIDLVWIVIFPLLYVLR